MAEAPEWMSDDEGLAYLDAECDECGVANSDCECLACTECLEFRPSAPTVDQNLQLCEPCAEVVGAELLNPLQGIRQAQDQFVNQFLKLKGDNDESTPSS